MKLPLRFLAFVAFAALPVLGRAQLTYENTDGSGSGTQVSSLGQTAIQTFTGFSNLSSMTWTLQNIGGSSIAASFNGYIALWDTGTNTAMLGSVQAFTSGTASLTAGIATFGTGTVTFTDSFSLNPSATYAVMLSYFSGDTNFVAQSGATPISSPDADFFGSGSAGFASTSSNQVSFQDDLEGTGADMITLAGESFTMSIDGIAGSPAPEPATAAVGIAAAFVSMLVGRRIRQRRALATAPLAA